MQIIRTLFLTVLLICSFWGYMMLVKRYLGVRGEFAPLFVFSAVACVIFFCGLLGILFAGAIAVMAAGAIAFGALAAQRIKGGSKFKLKPSLFGFFWAVGCLFFFSLMIRSRLTHYDNFSHWGIVIKHMLSANAFPAADTALIDFKNYPLGISSFVYYVCRFAGRYEQVMIIGQGLLIFSCFYAIFGIISEKKRFLLYAFLGLGCIALSFFNITIRINNLLVDFLLPIYTLAIFAVAYQHRADAKRAFITALPMAALLTVAKSTGIIFAAIGLIFLVYIVLLHGKGKARRKIALLALLTVLLALLPYAAWSQHMKLSFREVENKFDLQNMPAEKTTEQIQEITSLFVRTSTDLSTRPALGIAAFNLAAVGAILFNESVLKKKWNLWKALLALDMILLLYYIGIWALYAYSMPWDEASWLAGFERYASSIVILFAGGLVLTATVDMENAFYYRVGQAPEEQAFKSIGSKNNYQKGVLVCMAVGMTMLLSEYNGMVSILNTYDSSLPHKVESVTGDQWYENGVEDSRRYLFYAPDVNAQVTNFYMQYVGRYFLYAPQVDGICLFYEDNMENLLSGYDYLVIVESDMNERYLLKKHYGVSGQEGMYQIHNTDAGISLVSEGMRKESLP